MNTLEKKYLSKNGTNAFFASMDLPRSQIRNRISKLFAHGGIYMSTDMESMTSRLEKGKMENLISPQTNVYEATKDIKLIAEEFMFSRLIDNDPYFIPEILIDHLSKIGGGRTYSEEDSPSDKVPAFMTFVGQFIDHDLTMNLITLLAEAAEDENVNAASPLIDLDSVYGGRKHGQTGDESDIVSNGKFILREVDNVGPVDLPRKSDGKAFINDFRNDENQILSQLHVLVLRLHNALFDYKAKSQNGELSNSDLYDWAKNETIKSWQSFVWNEYLPTIVSQEALDASKAKIKHEGLPFDGSIKLPREFAIGFRMGHSQLRSKYKLNKKHEDEDKAVDLFVGGVDYNGQDLRGDRPLAEDRVIDWEYFISNQYSANRSNKIDEKVTKAVFEIPKSAVPDKATHIRNLAKRNLLRNRQEKLASAESLAEFYNLPDTMRLTIDDIEPSPSNQNLFKRNDDGDYDDDLFRTPLWFYVIREAEIQQDGQKLGALGGRIVAETILRGITRSKNNFHLNDWKSAITGTNHVQFKDIVDFVIDRHYA